MPPRPHPHQQHDTLHLAVSVKAPRQNQVLIAARTPLADDGLLPLPGYTEAATTNWLHRRLPALQLEVVGFRAPMYLAADDRLGYWRQVEDIARPVIVLGDFCCDPHTDTRPCAALFPRLTADGYTLAQPKGDWSCHAGKDGSGRHAPGNSSTRNISPSARSNWTRTLSRSCVDPSADHCSGRGLLRMMRIGYR